ncbi:MAG: hypothetical protein AAB509_03625 [Patescibacteria group bacterium]
MGRQKRWFPGLTNEQKEKLRELRQQGLTAKKISELDLLGPPHRPVDNIQDNMSRFGLVGKNRSLATKNRKHFSNGEKQEFNDFLRQNSLRFTPRQIAEKFGVKKDTVTARQRFLRIKARLAQNNPRILFEKYIAEREKQLEVLAQKLREQKRILPLEDRRCKKCEKVWLRHKKFFFHTIHRTNCGTSWNFWLVCVICAAKQRHQKRVAQRQPKISVIE